MLMPLPDADRTRLVRLLGMLNSSFDAERATAGALADKFIRERRLTWEQVVARDGVGHDHQDQPYRSSPARSGRRTWRNVCADCLHQPEKLNQWERDFLASISTWRGSLTRKQAAKLNDIATRLGVPPAP